MVGTSRVAAFMYGGRGYGAQASIAQQIGAWAQHES